MATLKVTADKLEPGDIVIMDTGYSWVVGYTIVYPLLTETSPYQFVDIFAEGARYPVYLPAITQFEIVHRVHSADLPSHRI